ncbi:MAG TPA: cytochrome P450 [Acidimicrobiales bacterium]|nr:cytochrome P450 [Acidimicrobiales bacterium]
MQPTSAAAAPTSQADQEMGGEEWWVEHFDHASPEVASHIHDVLRDMRARCPVTHSQEYGGHWVVTGYADVLEVAQDWRTFSSAQGVGLTDAAPVVPPIPEWSDPPVQREYKRLINAYFTPAVVSRYEQPIRTLATALVDGFVERGQCEFMAEFARPFPGLAFFDQVLHAPPDEIAHINDLSTAAATPNHPLGRKAWEGMFGWITEFVAQRRRQSPRQDVVDAVLGAHIEGRPITDAEVYGLIQLLILGGLDTTAGALGQFVVRFAREPAIPELLRSRPELIPAAVEELLRLEGPFVFIGRRVTRDAVIGGKEMKAGERALISWASANRDEKEFEDPDTFDLSRRTNRHVAFGAGPHRCAGSNFARMNLRIALEELLMRLDDIRLDDGAEPIAYHSAFNRAPLRVPITFTPGPRVLGEDDPVVQVHGE